ncbi:MAG: hypothetical protein E1N59_233 [Puniceicoccaceae bacterium 5H]|nr:MAG: hypothetical protein E1N59_233 [Puniceicoccaceae bacterium 5H]
MTILVQFFWYFVLLSLSLVAGSVYLLLLYPLTGGSWMEYLRPALRRHVSLWWVPCLGFLVLLLLFQYIAYWPEPPTKHLEELAHQREAFLNWPFFIGRNVFYLVVFAVAGLFLGKRGGERGQPWAAPAIVGMTLTMFFIAVDWVMLRDAEWFSTGFPFTYILLSVLFALCSATLATKLGEAPEKARRQIGSLIQASTIVSAYLAIAELVIIWMGDLPVEAQLYVERSHLPWSLLIVYVAICGVAWPFISLLSRQPRVRPARIKRAALLAASGMAAYLLWFLYPIVRPF